MHNNIPKTNLMIYLLSARKHCAAMCLFIFFCLSARAANYFVSPTGEDMNTGLSAAAAFLTIQRGADLVSSGDTVFVANGTYAGFDVRGRNGAANAPIVFKALGDDVLINTSGPIRDDGINVENADYVVIEGFTVKNMPGSGNGIRLVLSDHCVVRHCWCDGNAERGIFTGFTDDILIEYNTCTNSVDEHGIYVSNSSDRPIIRFNECYGNNNIGIHMNGDLSLGGDGIISDPQIYGNIIHDNNRAAGINMDGVENALIYNNLIYNNHFSQGIALFQQDGAQVSSGARIFNNTIIVPDDGRWGILLKAGANQNTIILNNMIINEHAWRGAIAAEAIDGLTSDYNLLSDKLSAVGDGEADSFVAWQALGLDQQSQIVAESNDLFSNPTENNYQLLPTAQAVDAGTNSVADIVDVDIVLTPRPQGNDFDIGAYEYANITDVSTVSESDQWIVYPNPVSAWFGVKHSDKEQGIRAALYDASGRLLQRYATPNSSLRVLTTDLMAGAYYLRIFPATDQVVVKKLVVLP